MKKKKEERKYKKRKGGEREIEVVIELYVGCTCAINLQTETASNHCDSVGLTRDATKLLDAIAVNDKQLNLYENKTSHHQRPIPAYFTFSVHL